MEGVMFQEGQSVFYKNMGVCEIVSICTPTDKGCSKPCYMLRPLSTNGSTFYVPVDRADQLLRALLSPDEALKLIHKMPTMELLAFHNIRERDPIVKEIFKSGSQERLISLMRTMHTKPGREGKSLTAKETEILGNAEKLLYDELSVVLDIPYSEVYCYIERELTKKVAT